MAAYAATVTTKMVHAVRLGKFGFFSGEIDITNYNTTLAEITGISSRFKSIIGVTFGASDLAHVFEWIDASSSIKAYVMGTGAEAATDTDAGAAHFTAFGLLS